MAKIKRLFPEWNIPSPDEVNGHSLKAAVASAEFLIKEVPDLQGIAPFDEETKKAEMPQPLRSLLRFMLVPDPAKRPSAASVLTSREFLSLRNLTLTK